MTKTTPYKNTSIGPIPTEWEVKLLKEIANIKGRIGYRGYTVNDIVNKGAGAVTISPSNFTNGSLDIKDSTYISWDKYYESPEIMVKNNDILLVKTGSTYGKSCLVSNLTELATINPQIVIIKDVNQDIRYLSYIVSDKIFQNQISKIVVGGAIPTLSQEAVLKFSIPLPPLPEQQKIAEVLSTWDKAIQDTDAIIKKLQNRNKALAFSLLTGKKRVKGFEGKWRNLKIKEVFSEVKDINDGNDVHKVLTISAKNGFVSQEDKFDRVIAGNSLKKYTLLKKGDFAYNKGNSKTYEYGCIYVLDKYPSALVPFVYICFRPTLEISIDFYRHWFFNHSLDNQLRRIITSGARGDGLLNVSKDDFFNLKVVFPSLEEQNAIAEILNTANQEVKQYQQKLEALKLQKKGLMQQLLTGKVRTV